MYIIAEEAGGSTNRLIFTDADEPRNVIYQARYLSRELDRIGHQLRTFFQDAGSISQRVEVLTLA